MVSSGIYCLAAFSLGFLDDSLAYELKLFSFVKITYKELNKLIAVLWKVPPSKAGSRWVSLLCLRVFVDTLLLRNLA